MTAIDPYARTHWWDKVNLNHLPKTPPVQPTLGQLGSIGLVYPGLRHIFSGPPESAKTLAAYLLLIEVARTGHLTLLIDFEMGAYNARDRLVDLGATEHELDNIVYVDPDVPATEQQLEKLRIEASPNLVVIDASAGAYDLQGLDDNSRRDVGHIYRLYVEPFFRDGVATIFIDHVVKNAETRGKFAIGSERKVGVADVHLGFTVVTPISRGHTGLYKIHTHKDRGGFLKRGILAELELTSDPDTHRITHQLRPADEVEPGGEFIYTKRMQEISQLLEKQPDVPTMNQLADLAGGTRQVALKAISKLAELGYITIEHGARNSKLLHHVKPFTVLEWENQPDPSTGSDWFATGSANHSHPLVRNPPYGGSAEPVESPPNQSTGSEWSWVDELAPRDEPPADLHDDPHPF